MHKYMQIKQTDFKTGSEQIAHYTIIFWSQKWWCIILLLLLTIRVLSAMPCHSHCCAWHCQVWYHFVESGQAKEGWWQCTNHWVWAEQLFYVECHRPTKEILMSSKWIRKHLSQGIGHEHPAICLQNLALFWIRNYKLMSRVAVWSPNFVAWTWYLHLDGKTALNKMQSFQRTRKVQWKFCRARWSYQRKKVEKWPSAYCRQGTKALETGVVCC